MSHRQRDLFDGEHAAKLRQAQARGDDGMQRAADHADRAVPDWGGQALAAVRRAAARRVGAFTFEQLREDIADVPEPPDLRAWGAIVRAARRRKIIVATGGYAPTACSNCSPAPLYVAGDGANVEAPAAAAEGAP